MPRRKTFFVDNFGGNWLELSSYSDFSDGKCSEGTLAGGVELLIQKKLQLKLFQLEWQSYSPGHAQFMLQSQRHVESMRFRELSGQLTVAAFLTPADSKA